MDDVIDTGMAGLETAQKLAVCSVYDCIAAQGGDIPLPENDPAVDRTGSQAVRIRNPFFTRHFLQVIILNLQELF